MAVEGPVATVSLDRPEVRNAQTPQMWAGLAAIGRQLPGDVRVVVLTGSGPSFSAGLDRAELADLGRLATIPEQAAADIIAGYQEAFTWWRDAGRVSIAAVRGHAVGAGFQLALACDLRVLAGNAQFCMAETALGLVPDLGGTQRLVELVGYPQALEICLTGRRVNASEAARLGLAELVVTEPELDRAVADLVAAILAAPRGAVAETKALLAAAAGRSFAEQCRFEREAQVRRIRDLAGAGEEALPE